MISKLGGQCFLAPKNDYSRNPILELAQITWPMPFLQQCQSVRSQTMGTLAEPSRLLFHQEVTQLRNVRLSLAQRRQIYSKKAVILAIETRFSNNRFPSCSQGTNNSYS